MSMSCLRWFSVVILLTFFATLESRFVTVNLFKRTYVYLVVYIYLFQGQSVTVKSIYPICHYVREHMYALLHTSISSAPSSGADPTKTSILIRIRIFEFTRRLTVERCECFPIGGVNSMPVNIVSRVQYNFTNYLYDIHRVLLIVFFSISLSVDFNVYILR